MFGAVRGLSATGLSGAQALCASSKGSPRRNVDTAWMVDDHHSSGRESQYQKAPVAAAPANNGAHTPSCRACESSSILRRIPSPSLQSVANSLLLSARAAAIE